MLCRRFVAALAIAGAVAGPALAQQHGGPHGGPAGGGGHFAHSDGTWAAHPAWVGHGEFNHWRQGHWWHGTYEGRTGYWWIVGADWYWYPAMVAPIPEPTLPPGMAPGYWYYCDAYRQYYPYVGACPSGWRAVLPQP